MNSHEQFATAISCINGKIQIPVIQWIKNTYLVEYIDMITEITPGRIIAENKNQEIIAGIKNRVATSITAVKIINSWNYYVPVIGLWINEQQNVREIK